MTQLRIEIKGLEAVQAKLGIPLDPLLGPAFLVIGEQLRDIIATYPGPVKYPFVWGSEAQRQAYMARRREVGAGLPYVRNSDLMSERLGPSWTVQMTPMGAVVGTVASYAKWVQGDDDQQPGHAVTGWKTDKAAAKELISSGAIEKIVTKAVMMALGG